MVGSSHLSLWQVRVRPPRRYDTRSSHLHRHNDEPRANFYEDMHRAPSIDGGRPAAYDPVGMMLLPPPYNPDLYPSDQLYQPPTEGRHLQNAETAVRFNWTTPECTSRRQPLQ